MSIHVALNHQSRYRYDRLVGLSPQEVRLKPAPHCRTPILAYSLKVTPAKHFVNWQQDVYGNFIARYVFPEKTREFEVTVDLVADMTVINPFDFFVESYAEKYPFAYAGPLGHELAPFLAIEDNGPQLKQWLDDFRAQEVKPGMLTIDFLTAVNRRLQGDIRYLVRMEPGVQSCERTLGLKSGSCRDSGWLLVQILRHCGLAARFVSGYLIQLAADVKSLDGPSGPERDFTDLHAWAEVYIPGAGWIGLDATSGLLAGEGHIPLACTASPGSAAPITGATDPCESQFEFSMSVTRIHEDPRVTKPYSDAEWRAIDEVGRAVDRELVAGDVRLTQGGEPTFVSIDDMDGPEWNYTALSDEKLALAMQLHHRMQQRLAPRALLHYGQGKWYPGEPLPRWALGVYWRRDGQPVWRDQQSIAFEPTRYDGKSARTLVERIARELGFSNAFVIPAYEDPLHALEADEALPLDIDPSAMDEPAQRARLAEQLQRGLREPAGFVLPLRATKLAKRKQTSQRWESSLWPLRRKHLLLVPGDSPLGYRLPLASLPEYRDPGEEDIKSDPSAPLPAPEFADASAKRPLAEPKADPSPAEIVRTALCVEVRNGCLYVFMPPLPRIEDYLALTAIVEACAEALYLKIRVDGYEPPGDLRMQVLKITPDPGVIEVNVQPVASWDELVANTTALYADARETRLATEKFMLDGRHTGTGGGNHVTLGGATPEDSPLLRRPDLLKSLITYWQNHPSLSYLFAGQFVGPTSQAPRVDEARDDNLYELEIAFQQITRHMRGGEEALDPPLVDRLLRNLLVDLTGNTHRAEFCIDKLYAPETSTGRLGLLEFRAFEMPPHAQMSLVQMLLLRALIARFWKTPYAHGLVRWGTQLHDRFMLPYFIAADIRDVVRDLNAAGYKFDEAWFAPFLEFRFPRYGTVNYANVELELRQAMEPWHVLGEQMSAGTTARYVDSSVERLQVKASGLTSGRYRLACNGREVPLQATGVPGEAVAGVRYRAWAPPSALHPTIGIQAPLVFDLVDTWSSRSVGGCTYHVAHPGGRNYETFPVNANEAEARRIARFWNHGHTPGALEVTTVPPNPAFPLTLDLRWHAR